MAAESLTENKFELGRIEVKSFMGISHDSPVILDFTKLRKKKNITILEGNQGVGKSSTMTALMYALGAELDFRKENIVNIQDDTVSISVGFTANGNNYRVRVNKSKFALEMWNEDANVWLGAGEPKATLKKLLGPVATSPMFLKSKKGRDQIKWFREYFTKEHSGPGRKPKEETIMDELDQRTKTRRDINREYDKISKSLANNPLYQDREANYKKFEKPVTVDEARKSLQDASAKKSELDRAVAGLEQMEVAKVQQLNRIQELEQMLAQANKDYENTLQRIENGIKWIEENKDAITSEYNEATNKYENINNLAIEYNEWKRVLEDEKVMNEYADLSVKLTGEIDDLRNQLLTLTKKYLPKMKGLELKIATGIDDGEENKEGLFYNGKSIAQLSESELWEIFLAVCDHNEVNFVFIENVSSLGSNAVEVINQLAAHDVKVFATEQNRKLNKMEITITDKID